MIIESHHDQCCAILVFGLVWAFNNASLRLYLSLSLHLLLPLTLQLVLVLLEKAFFALPYLLLLLFSQDRLLLALIAIKVRLLLFGFFSWLFLVFVILGEFVPQSRVLQQVLQLFTTSIFIDEN